jgi:membrane protease YdiL (CAAX protease family)
MTSNEFFFDAGGTLRSGFRAAVFITAFIVAGTILGALVIGAFLILGLTPDPASPSFFTVNSVVSLIAALLVGWLCGRTLEGLSFSALGASFVKGWLKHLISGLVAGAAALTASVGIAWALGGLSFAANGAEGGASIALQLTGVFFVFAASAAFEEAFFRGYLLQTFARSGLAWLAIVLTSVFFGGAHLMNPNATAISTVNTMLAGVMFAFAYLRTRDLWFPFGIHLMWNWVQGAIFGIEVSGLNEIAGFTLLKEIDRGPVWLTGENYGIEGGIACTVALLIAIDLIRFMPGAEARTG